MKTQEQILEFLKGMEDEDILQTWQDLAYWNGSVEPIYNMEELDDIMGECYPTDLLNKLDSDFDINDYYFYDSIWGISSFNDIYDVIDLDELADNIDYVQEEAYGIFWNSELVDFLLEE